MFSARPGTIKEIIEVDEPHPRKPDFVTSEKFTAIRNQLYGLLHDEIRKTMADSPAGAERRDESVRQRARAGSPAHRAGGVPDRAVVLWYLATTRWGVSPLLLPNPVQVGASLGHPEDRRVLGDLRVTLTELAIAFAISATSGVTLGYLISRSPYRIRVFEPLLAGIYSVPIILFLPLYVLFFGLGPASKIALGATISFFPIALNTIAGFGYVDTVLVTAARSMGASDDQLFRYVLLPAALPIILTGMRMGFTVALLSIIGSETIASLAGLGHRIVHLAEAWRCRACSPTSPSWWRSPRSSTPSYPRSKRGQARRHDGVGDRRIRRVAAPAWLARIGVIVLLFILWEFAARWWVDPMFLSPPSRVLDVAAGGVRHPRRAGGAADHVLGAWASPSRCRS